MNSSKLFTCGSLTLPGTSGSSINHLVMDRHPIPRSFLPPLLIELQQLILIEHWRLIYMIQVQSEQWFFSVKDSSTWHSCAETMKDWSGEQESRPQVRWLASCVLSQNSAPRKMSKWSLAKGRGGKERGKKRKSVIHYLCAYWRACGFIWACSWTKSLEQFLFKSLIAKWHVQEWSKLNLASGMVEYEKPRFRRT